MGDVKLALLLGVGLGRTVPVAMHDRHALGARALRRAARAATAARRGRWRSRSGRSWRSEVSSRCSPGAPSSTGTWGCSDGGVEGHRQPAGSAAHRRTTSTTSLLASRTATLDVGGRPGGHGDLVADVIRATGPADAREDRRRRARSAGGSSFSQALVEEGFASALGVARRLAEQYHLPLVDLAVAGVDADVREVDRPAGARARLRDPVLERQHDPEGRDHEPAGRARPRRAQACDATERRVLRRRQERRADRAPPARARGRGDERVVPRRHRSIGDDEDDQDDLEADDGISDAPLVRLVNSMIFQAAEDGASDIHVEPQEDELIVRYRIDGVLHVAQRVPEAARRRCDDAPEGAREARHRRAAQAAGRPHHPRPRRPPAGCSTSASRRCRPSRARP